MGSTQQVWSDALSSVERGGIQMVIIIIYNAQSVCLESDQKMASYEVRKHIQKPFWFESKYVH